MKTFVIYCSCVAKLQIFFSEISPEKQIHIIESHNQAFSFVTSVTNAQKRVPKYC